MNPLSQLFMDPDFLDQLLAGRVVPPQQPIENDRLADVFGRNVAVNRNRNRPTAKPPPFTTGFEHPNQQQFNRGPLGVIEQDPAAFAKGVAIAPFTAAPDILGMGINGVNALNSMLQKKTGIPIAQFGTMSGDPLRELIGLDPKSGQGMAGEIVSPVGTMAKALGVSAKAVAAGAKLAAGTNFDPSLAMTLFHGTPFKFNKFNLDKIGTGEGAQAFGHGLYFAENPGVAKSYQSALSGFDGVHYKGQRFDGSNIAAATDDLAVNEVLAAAAVDGKDGARKMLNDRKQFLIDSAEGFTGPDPALDGVNEALRRFDDIMKDVEVPSGHLYEVEIPDEITNRMLDWDAPLSEQPESVRKSIQSIVDQTAKDVPDGIIAELGNDFGNGADFYRSLSADLGGGSNADALASTLMGQEGIPGIRFFDGSSRKAGEGTRNIVVFNPDDIRQVKRDGEVVFENKLGIGN